MPDGPVIKTRRHHRLRVDIDAARQQPVDLAEDVAFAGIAHHLHPGHGIRGVDRDMDGAQAFAHDAVQLGIVAAGERREMAVEKGQADVLVLQVERLPEALGHLVDEAEHAVLLADLHLVLGQVHADGIAPVFHEGLEGAAIRSLDEHGGLIVPGDEVLEVQLVQHRLAMDLQQGVTRPEPRLLGQAAGFHRDDLHACLGQGDAPCSGFPAGIRR